MNERLVLANRGWTRPSRVSLPAAPASQGNNPYSTAIRIKNAATARLFLTANAKNSASAQSRTISSKKVTGCSMICCAVGHGVAPGWFSDNEADRKLGVEIADLCNTPVPRGVDGWLVTQLWSNVEGRCVPQ